MSYLLMWLLLTIGIGAVLLLLGGFLQANLTFLHILMISTTIAAALVANEIRRPQAQEYNRKKALYPRIPDEFLSSDPPSGGVVFGKDIHTGKFVAEENRHCMVVGSTGSGKTASVLLPSILSHSKGSAQIIDIKSRELTIKSADIQDPKTIIVDLDYKADHIWGWDILYRLKRDGSDTENEVLQTIREVASIVIPKSSSGDQFWNDSARSLFTGLALFEIVYAYNYEFIDVIHTMMNVPLREHLDLALNTVPKTSLVASYLTSIASTADETLFSCDISMCACLYNFLGENAVWALRDNPKRANPRMLNQEGIRQYLCVSEEQLDCGLDKIMNIIMKETLMEIQSRTTNGRYPDTTLYWDEFQKLSESVEPLRQAAASFLKTARSKHCALVMVVQNLDGFDKQLVYDILSNVHFLHVLSSNNANSLTSEVVCKMAGSYYEKSVSTSEGKGTSTSTSFAEKAVLKPEDLNALGEDAVLIITNHGYVRVNREKTMYYKAEPFKAKYEKIYAVNRELMADL